ncbi:hypothetical protein [Zavarzinella formosa]|uniref:hypothetical protein n=1 Tax=Zavarzinella formosa TaxID=360055 RepID=UPI0002EF16D7|nr:hypothetical protein [Zavarzinella formosa]
MTDKDKPVPEDDDLPDDLDDLDSELDDEDDEEEASDDVVEGAAVFPEIPEELGIHPLMLGIIHAFVFLDGSDPDVVSPPAAGEAMEYLATYLQRLKGDELRRAKEDMEAMVGYAKAEKWPKQYVLFLKSFLADVGVTE